MSVAMSSESLKIYSRMVCELFYSYFQYDSFKKIPVILKITSQTFSV